MNEKISVLIASSNGDFLNLLNNRLLKMTNISSVETATDGTEAYNKIIKLKPDVAVVDGIMPKLDGLGLLEKLEGKSTSKIIVMSAIANETVVCKALSLGALNIILSNLLTLMSW